MSRNQDSKCDYCGLPVRAASDGLGSKRYCCVGCRIAADVMSEVGSDRRLGQTVFRLGLAVFFSMNVMVFTMALWSWDAYSVAPNARSAAFKELMRLGCLLFATPVLIFLGQPLFQSLVAQLRSRIFSSDVLLLVGVAAAYGYSVVSIDTGGEHIYLEIVCMILLAVTIGRWIEANGKQRAMKSLETLQDILPDSARLITPNGTGKVALDQVQPQQRIRVLPGERIPLDGVVDAGQSFVDLSMITGESNATSVTVGDSVFGGVVNLDGCLDVEVTSSLESTVVQRLIELVRESARRPGRVERLADRWAARFAGLIFVVSTSVFLYQLSFAGFHDALMASMAVVLIACPCALAVATPLAVWAAIGQAATHGMVFRSSDDLLRLASVNHFCFDKTGTVTTDNPRLASAIWSPGNEQLGAELTRLLASRTHHPLAQAAFTALDEPLRACSSHSDARLELLSSRTIPGSGVLADVVFPTSVSNGSWKSTAVLGSRDFCLQQGMIPTATIEDHFVTSEEKGRSAMYVGWDGRIHGGFAFDEQVRTAVVDVFQRLRDSKLSVELLTGDRHGRANQLAEQLNVKVSSELLPEDKLDRIKTLQSNERVVAMVGDGLNDAPALSAADVGIAMGCGVEVSRDAADVCLMSANLAQLPWAVGLARDTQRTIRRNLIWSFSYNVIGIAIASTGRLSPIVAAVAMVLSSGFVITESLRLAARASASAPNVSWVGGDVVIPLDSTINAARSDDSLARSEGVIG